MIRQFLLTYDYHVYCHVLRFSLLLVVYGNNEPYNIPRWDILKILSTEYNQTTTRNGEQLFPNKDRGRTCNLAETLKKGYPFPYGTTIAALLAHYTK